MKVFLSWSKKPSEDYAKVIYEYLPMMINIKTEDIFMSKESINLGENGIGKINERLSESGFGLLFMTPNNKNETWLNFEAGAISKGLSTNRVTPLVFDAKTEEVLSGGPIANLQGIGYSKDNLLKIVLDINESLPKELLKDRVIVEKTFSILWSEISKKINDISGEKSWYSKEEINPDPVETKINRIYEILEYKAISAQESYNQNQVINWTKYGIEKMLPIFNNILSSNINMLKKNPDYLFSNELYNIVSRAFFEPPVFPEILDSPNNKMDIMNLFKMYSTMNNASGNDIITFPLSNNNKEY